MNVIRTHVYLPEKQHRAMRDEAARRTREGGVRVSLAELVREAIDLWLSSPKEGRKALKLQ